MTLRRQIFWLLNISFLLVLLVVFVVQMNTSRAALAQQMESNVQNASVTLGLSLAPYLQTQDRGGVDTVLQSMFDAGFYRTIELDWYAKAEHLVKDNPPRARHVPDWFMALPLFSPVAQEQTLTAGWIQVAKLKVVANPAIAYQALWRTAWHLLLLLGGIYLLLVVIVWRGLKVLMRPLDAVTRQARLITKRQFGEPIAEPRTRELSLLVRAINEMADRIHLMFDSQDRQITHLRQATQTDPVSGLPNRSHLVSHLDAWLSEPGSGGLMLIDLHWLQQLSEQQGFQVRDQLLSAFASQLKQWCSVRQRCLCARISLSEFAVLYSIGDKVTLTDEATSLAKLLHSFSAGQQQDEDNLALALVLRGSHRRSADILASADTTLHRAWQQQSRLAVDAEQGQGPSQSRWRSGLRQALDEGELSLMRQSVMACQGERLLHYEWFPSIHLDGEDYTAGTFLSYIEQFQLGQALDAAVLKKLQQLPPDEHSRHAINLSLATVRSPQALLTALAASPNLMVEISEDVALADPGAAKAFVAALRRQRGRFGVDHVGRHLASLKYLHDLAPDYIKLDQSLALYDDSATLTLVRALTDIGHGLKMQVIATRVETPAAVTQLQGVGADGYQGYLHPPQKVE
ncbi:EAL domain-containing protein [Gallaecimonas sp. GXIMD1310]|uniref:bifunctional diguanylate cyclase/phosphodiesterase n=1 Tax=Gallaecimonas sp. GXIMD1310 TaxID=3131926 RepID=UPI0032550EB5